MDEVWKKKAAWRKEQESRFRLEGLEGLDWCFWGTQGTHVGTTRVT